MDGAATLTASAQRIVLVALLGAYIVAPGALPGIGLAAPTVLLLVAAALALWGSRLRLNWRIVLPYLVFFATLAVSQTFAAAGPDANFPRLFVLAGIAFYVTAHYTSRRILLKVVAWLLPLLVASALLVFAQFLAPTSWLGAWVVYSQYLLGWGLFGDRIAYGMLLIAGTVALVTASALSRRGWIFLGVPVLMMAGFVSGLRSAWLGLFAAIVLFTVLTRRWRLGLLVLVLFGVSYYATHQAVEWVQSRPEPPAPRAPAIFGRMLPPPPSSRPQVLAAAQAADVAYKVRIEWAPIQRQLAEELSLGGRIGIARTGLAMWRENLLFGVGLGRFEAFSSKYAPEEQLQRTIREEEKFDPHNMIVALVAETGLVGLLGFLAMIGLIFSQFIRRSHAVDSSTRMVMTAGLAAVAGLAVVGLAQDVHLYRLWWLILGVWHGASYLSES